MVTNLPAEAKAKWIKVIEAKTPEEKLRALEEFLSAVPKHKGTEKLIGRIRRQMAVLRREIEEKRKRKAGKGPKFFVEKEGAAQIIILGFTNSGKSQLLKALTNAKPQVSPIPYTTKLPIVGMMPFKDIKFQLVEAPALFKGAAKGVGWGLKTLGLVRNADAILIVLDGANNPLEQFKSILKELEEARITIGKPKGKVEITRKSTGGIQVVVFGKIVDGTVRDIIKILKDYKIHHALVKIYGEVSLNEVEISIFGGITYKPAIVLINKSDMLTKKEIEYVTSKIQEIIGDHVRVYPISALKGVNTETLGEILFNTLELIRIYTKQPGVDKPSPEPLVLRRGATVLDVAERIHSRLFKNFKYAKIWGPSAKYPGERVGGNHVVMDGDIVEIHAKA